MKSYTITQIKKLHKDEVWHVVDGFFDYYSVSNYGRIFSKRKSRLLKPMVSTTGYPIFTPSALRKGIKTKTVVIHRLVGKYFISGYRSGMEINHKDGIKTNNSYTNLEWLTPSENSKHAYDTGLSVMSDGRVRKIAEKNSKAVVRTEVNGTKSFYKNMTTAAKKLGTTIGNIHNYVFGKYKPRDKAVWKLRGLE